MKLPRERTAHPGPSRLRGQVTDLVPSRPDGFLTTPEAARLIGAKPWLIRKWRSLGILMPQGLDERGYPLHTPEAVQAAEERVRLNGLAKGGYDPRRLRGRSRETETTEADSTELAA
jgi:hypothetical protein